MRARFRPTIKRVALAAVALAILVQIVPYGRGHANPPTTKEPAWDSARTRTLALRACGDCHSNLTSWPVYSNVAPISWLVQRDVDDGRATLNFSTWDRPQRTHDIVEVIADGSMPPWYYTPLHPRADLSAADRAALVQGLRATLAASPAPPGSGGRSGQRDDRERDDARDQDERGRP